jgi:putative addiction module component (TIGR02574 family)
MNNRGLDKLRHEALELTSTERAELAHDLVVSLDAPADMGVAEAWDGEVLRRLEQIESGTAALIDREEFTRRMRERLTRP